MPCSVLLYSTAEDSTHLDVCEPILELVRVRALPSTCNMYGVFKLVLGDYSLHGARKL